jgi:hypothetical protein
MAKPKIAQNGVTLSVQGDAYAARWYRDGKIIEGANKASLAISEKGKYKALVKVEEGNDSWLLSDEIEIRDLNSGTTRIIPGRNKKAQPKLRKLHHKVDVKGRRAD